MGTSVRNWSRDRNASRSLALRLADDAADRLADPTLREAVRGVIRKPQGE